MDIKVGDIVKYNDFQRGANILGKVIRVINVIESFDKVEKDIKKYTIKVLGRSGEGCCPDEIGFADIIKVYKEQDLNTFKTNKVQINKEQKGSGSVYLEPPTTPRPPAPPNYKVGRKPL